MAEELLTTIGLHTIYLPNLYISRSYPEVEQPQKKSGLIDVGCFGAIRPLKNNLIQAVAAIKFAKKLGKQLRFHINSNRVEQNGDQVIKNINALFNAAGNRYTLVKHKWMPHQQFMDVIGSMDMGMQVSFSETFNIVAADFVDAHVPIVVSKEISWIPSVFHADPNSSDDIVNKMMLTWYVKQFKLHHINNLALWLYNRKAKRHWLNFLA